MIAGSARNLVGRAEAEIAAAVDAHPAPGTDEAIAELSASIRHTLAEIESSASARAVPAADAKQEATDTSVEADTDVVATNATSTPEATADDTSAPEADIEVATDISTTEDSEGDRA